MDINSKQPIGIFDSGLGGLMVAHTISKLLPQESIIYFGDTAHVPWGDKSISAIQAYSVKICNVLLRHNCKIIVIACNTSSAVAHDLLKCYINQKTLLVDGITPIINHLLGYNTESIIGLIGSQLTIQSHAYPLKLKEYSSDLQLKMLGTPLLAPLIEAGLASHTITNQVIQSYLSHLRNVDALVLACTHYPLIKPFIEKFYEGNMPIIDPAQVLAHHVKSLLKSHNLHNNHQDPALRQFYVSEYTEAFSLYCKTWFPTAEQAKKYPLT